MLSVSVLAPLQVCHVVRGAGVSSGNQEKGPAAMREHIQRCLNLGMCFLSLFFLDEAFWRVFFPLWACWPRPKFLLVHPSVLE